jgi:uncharacterized protein
MESNHGQHPDVVIKETSRASLNAPLLITGFVGPGLVGSISAQHLVQSLKLREIGYVKSKYVPPAAVFEGGQLRHPFTLSASSDGKLCVALCELPLRSDGLYQVAAALLDWAEARKAREVVVIDGLGVQGVPVKYQTFWAAEKGRCGELKAKGQEILDRGFIFGLAGCILNECLSREIMGVALLVPASETVPDPGAAAAAISSLNTLYGLKVDVSQLTTEERKIKEKLRELAGQYQKLRQLEKKRDVPERMYG